MVVAICISLNFMRQEENHADDNIDDGTCVLWERSTNLLTPLNYYFFFQGIRGRLWSICETPQYILN